MKYPIVALSKPAPGVKTVVVGYGFDLIFLEFFFEADTWKLPTIVEHIAIIDEPELANIYSVDGWNLDMLYKLVRGIDVDELQGGEIAPETAPVN